MKNIGGFYNENYRSILEFMIFSGHVLFLVGILCNPTAVIWSLFLVCCALLMMVSEAVASRQKVPDQGVESSGSTFEAILGAIKTVFKVIVIVMMVLSLIALCTSAFYGKVHAMNASSGFLLGATYLFSFFASRSDVDLKQTEDAEKGADGVDDATDSHNFQVREATNLLNNESDTPEVHGNRLSAPAV